MWRVIARFDDIQDGFHRYKVGDTYPRTGCEPTTERIEELSGSNNRLGVPIIEECEEPEKRKKRK